VTSGVSAPLTAADRAQHLEHARASVPAQGLRSGGREYCRSLCALTDEWVQQLFADVVAAHPPAKGRVALIAVGGYGRGELAPYSDLDLLLVHDMKSKKALAAIEPIASALWYPMWDAGIKLGHAVRSVKEQMALASEDLDSATALLTARPLAGDESLAEEVIAKGRAAWVTHSERFLGVSGCGCGDAKTTPAMWRIDSNLI
jgi:[protein-PII] uridylyltransferase